MTTMDTNYRLGIVDELQERRHRLASIRPRPSPRFLPTPRPAPQKPEPKADPTPLNSSTILRYVADNFDVTVDNLLEAGRLKRVSRARFAAYWLVRQLLGYSFPDTAYCLGKKDHTSSIHGVARAIHLHLTDDRWRQQYERAKRACLAHQSGSHPPLGEPDAAGEPCPKHAPGGTP